ncbi:MAG: hypothetical protein WDW38_008351 [Sanguina aurantia]
MRKTMEEDEQMKVIMAGFRGSNLDESDFALNSVKMTLVEMDRADGDTETLPLEYDPATIGAYWARRPVSVITRIFQLLGISGSFLSKLLWDISQGRVKETEVERAIDLRNIVTSLGPAYIKLGQALSIRPDLLSPAAMNELQKLCDKVPSFDSKIAMAVIQEELGKPWTELYAELTPEPIAAASLGQVYKGRLKTGEVVAVKVQRPYVLETVTIDLFIIRRIGMWLKRFPALTTDVVALLDEWAARFFEELDYVREGRNATAFAAQMKEELPQVVVPGTFTELTTRRVLTSEWMEGEKLSQSKADDVGDLVNIGVICYLKQLLETGFFHADPHPGNLIRTPDGRLAVLDFGLMTQIDDNIKFGMIEAISHLIHRDYEAIVKDFVTLDFIPEGTDLRPILPVLSKVFDQALEGGGAKNINFQELAADLAMVTYNYPFRIPPYFALIIRAIAVLEGIALVGNSDFALVDEAYPYISKRLLTDDSPRLRAALRYMVYGKEGVFDADRLIDLLMAFETFVGASKTARGDMDKDQPKPASSSPAPVAASTSPFPFPFPFPIPAFLSGIPLPFPFPAPAFSSLTGAPAATPAMLSTPLMAGAGLSGQAGSSRANASSEGAREALKFIFSPQGAFFREFIMEELVKSIDALSRDQLAAVVLQLGLQDVSIPLLLPGAKRSTIPLSPSLTSEDRKVVENVSKIFAFLTRGGRRRRRRGL